MSVSVLLIKLSNSVVFLVYYLSSTVTSLTCDGMSHAGFGRRHCSTSGLPPWCESGSPQPIMTDSTARGRGLRCYRPQPDLIGVDGRDKLTLDSQQEAEVRVPRETESPLISSHACGRPGGTGRIRG